jgi:hypothetical protein
MSRKPTKQKPRAKSASQKKKSIGKSIHAVTHITSLFSMQKTRANFVGTSISRDEIYYRLEWIFTNQYNPTAPHVIAPSAPIGSLLKNLTLEELWEKLDQVSPQAFHGITIPWLSNSNNPGVKDVKFFGDLINCMVAAYKQAGWTVTNGGVS